MKGVERGGTEAAARILSTYGARVAAGSATRSCLKSPKTADLVFSSFSDSFLGEERE
jgi:tRNA A37 threonylcarbamoyladenosine synthetase subunit TsaC/SUA5/YrdC